MSWPESPVELLDGEKLLLPQLEGMMEEYHAAWRMAEATDYHRDMRELERRMGFLQTYMALIRPPAQDTTAPLF
jgi:hypothetical protein